VYFVVSHKKRCRAVLATAIQNKFVPIREIRVKLLGLTHGCWMKFGLERLHKHIAHYGLMLAFPLILTFSRREKEPPLVDFVKSASSQAVIQL
jgi:hypothetical protein